MNHTICNPILPLTTYIPDGEPHVFGDRVYLYGSHDQAGGTCFCPLDYECWSAPVDDLTDWRCEGTIYRADQCPHYCEEKQDLYAPDVTQGPDGRYYLYYDLSGRAGKHGFAGPISVAVCDTPAGKYEYYGDVKYPDGRPLLRYIPFDPAVLNDDGHIYLTYGWGLGMDTHAPLYKLVMPYVMSRIFNKTVAEIRHEEPLSILGANIVELEDDMLTVKSEPRRILPAINNTPKGSRQRELITFCFLAAQGGCEPQLTAHAKGNMNIGNDKDFLIRVVSQCLPYIGYPRSLNAIQCVQKAAE